MEKGNSHQGDEGFVRLPQSLSLQALATAVSVAISLTLAWGVFSTRIAIVEKELVILQETVRENRLMVETMRREVRKLEVQSQDDVLILDQVYNILRRPPPRRSHASEQ